MLAGKLRKIYTNFVNEGFTEALKDIINSSNVANLKNVQFSKLVTHELLNAISPAVAKLHLQANINSCDEPT